MANDIQANGGYDPTMDGIIANHELPVILIVDYSGSMAMPATKIGQVNEGARRVLDYLKKDFAEQNPKTKPMFACLKFSDSAEWVNENNNPYVEAESYQWHDIDPDGGTYFGYACSELNKILLPKSEGGWLAGRKNCLKPIIVVMSDGQSATYTSELGVLKKRGWYLKALKFGIAIGSDADKQMLIDFTGSPEFVYDTDQFAHKNLADIIKIIVQQSSVISATTDTDDADANANAAKNITDTLNGAPGLGEEQP